MPPEEPEVETTEGEASGPSGQRPRTIRYRFSFDDGREEVFNLRMDSRTLELLTAFPKRLPLWTRLDFHQCPHCPLDCRTHPHCPLAVNLIRVVQGFDGMQSWEKVNVEVQTEERTVFLETSLQRAISSLMGLIMATSGCPHAAFFKPMARFHLPLASEEETIYRATSMYLLAQFFMKRRGQAIDFELAGLSRIYNDVEILNESIAERLRAATATDSTVNAVVLLDMFTKALPHSISGSLEKIEYLFEPFMQASKEGGRRAPSAPGMGMVKRKTTDT